MPFNFADTILNAMSNADQLVSQREASIRQDKMQHEQLAASTASDQAHLNAQIEANRNQLNETIHNNEALRGIAQGDLTLRQRQAAFNRETFDASTMDDKYKGDARLFVKNGKITREDYNTVLHFYDPVKQAISGQVKAQELLSQGQVYEDKMRSALTDAGIKAPMEEGLRRTHPFDPVLGGFQALGETVMNDLQATPLGNLARVATGDPNFQFAGTTQSFNPGRTENELRMKSYYPTKLGEALGALRDAQRAGIPATQGMRTMAQEAATNILQYEGTAGLTRAGSEGTKSMDIARALRNFAQSGVYDKVMEIMARGDQTRQNIDEKAALDAAKKKGK